MADEERTDIHEDRSNYCMCLLYRLASLGMYLCASAIVLIRHDRSRRLVSTSTSTSTSKCGG
ncbi:hypothetical protein BJY01DRAFT_142813 [Aspergillus pseudoustus]|uniref:Uncharacterized protein n=1 Tax=Aspergillus pseudoustus TaxID=1810923 RepID=A0ABR4IGN5_9EURO